jgi:hypothetical protein
MKSALLHVLVDLGKFKEIHSVCRIQTKEFGGDGMVLSYIRNKQAILTPATGIDMLLSENKMTVEEYRKMSHEFSFEEIITPMLPEMFTVLYPSYERKGTPDEALTESQVMDITGLQGKLEKSFQKLTA